MNDLKKAPKNVLIIGDSYSTFKGYVPEGNAIYYPRVDNDITRVEETWWHLLSNELNLNIVRNESWSGSTVCYTRYNNEDCSRTSSFIFRLNRLYENGFFTDNEIDTVLIFGGTNDSWANSPLGEETFTDYSPKNLFNVMPALSFIIKRAKEILPEANIVFIVNDSLKPEIASTVISASEHFGTSYALLKGIDKTNGHPTVKGMKNIKDQLSAFITEHTEK